MVRAWVVYTVHCVVYLTLVVQTFLLFLTSLYFQRKLIENYSLQRPQLKQHVPSNSPPLSRRRSSSVNSRLQNELSLRPKNFELFTGLIVWFVSFGFWIVCLLTSISIVPLNGIRLSCDSFLFFGLIVFQVCRTMMYVLFLMRVESTFAGTMHAYDPRMMAGMITTGAISSLSLMILELTIGKLKGIRHCADKSEKLCICMNTADYWYFGGVVFLDITFAGSACYLFTKPLRKVLAVQTSDNSDCHDQSDPLPRSNLKLQRLIVKYTLTTLTAIISTIALIFFTGILNLSEIGVCDLLINTVCVMFVTNWFDSKFKTVFALPVWIGDHCCGLYYPPE